MTFLAKKKHFPPQFFWELGRGSTPESSVYLAPRLPKGVNMMSLRGFRRGFPAQAFNGDPRQSHRPLRVRLVLPALAVSQLPARCAGLWHGKAGR